MTNEQFKKFVDSFTWTYAKTYAKVCPHEYIVKDKIDKDSYVFFEQVVRFIREKGFTAQYEGRAGQYYILDDHYYWTMGAPVDETTVLNRAKLSEYKLIDSSWVWDGER